MNNISADIVGMLGVLEKNIKNFMPEIEKGIYLATIDDEGRILVKPDARKNEYKWAGIADNEGNYFYVRHRDSGEIFVNPPADSRLAWCGHVKNDIRYELKIVACIRNGCPYTMENNIRWALAKTEIMDSQQIKKVDLIPTRSNINSVSILQEETGKQKQFDKNLIFVSVDFDLTFEMNYI